MEPTGDLRVGVAGDAAEAVVERAVAELDAAGVTPVCEDPSVLPARDVDAAMLFGEGGLLAYVRAGGDDVAPVVPVAAGRGVWSVGSADVGDAARSLVRGVDDADADAETRSCPILSVRADGETHRALFDVMVVTSEPARISEYAVAARGRNVVEVRADGVVVATPAGTQGYAGAAGAPTLSPDLGALAVVPIAPFSTDRDRWVVDDDSVRLGVTRDGGGVSLLVDDRDVARIGPDRPVTVARDGLLEVLLVPESRPFWPDGRRDWKNSNVGATD